MQTFTEQKEELLTLLSTKDSFLFFPNSLLVSLNKSGLVDLSGTMSNYNTVLLKIRLLKSDLINLTKFGMLTNSYFAWKFSIELLVNEGGKLDIWKQYVLKACIANDYIKSTMLNQAFVKVDNINVFINVKKINNKYIIQISPEMTQELTKDQVKSFLPRCIIIQVGHPISPEPIHELDISDDIQVELTTNPI